MEFCRPWTVGLAAALVFAAPASAQVLEIGDGGDVTVYDRPAVFTGQGATPIQPPVSPTAAAYAPTAAPAQVHTAIAYAAQQTALSPALVEAVARQESGLRHNAVSRVGAVGVMQLMPGTAAELGVDRFDLGQNVFGGAVYLRKMLERFRGDLPLALAAYNAGPEAVRRFGGVPPYSETRAYVSAILSRLALTAVPTTRP